MVIKWEDLSRCQGGASLEMSRNWIAATAILTTLSVLFGAASAALAQEKVHLTIMTHTFEALNDWVDDRVALYMELNPHVVITQVHVRPEDLFEAIMVRSAGGVTPDIINVHSRSFADLELLGMLDVPPDHIVQDIMDSFVPQAYQGIIVRDQLYGYPTEAVVQLPIAAVRMFQEHGMAYPTEFMQLLDVQRKMTREIDGRLLTAGVQLRTDKGWFADHWLMTLRALNGQFVDLERFVPLFNSHEGIAAIELHGQFLTPGITNHYSDRLGIRFSGSWFMTRGAAWSPGVDYEALPALADVNGNKTAWGYHWGMFVTSHSKQKEEAWRFVQWFNQAENRIGLIEQAYYLPIHYDNIPMYMSDPWFGTFVAEYVYAEPLPNIPRIEEIKWALRDELLPAVRGEIDPGNALEAAERRVQLLLDEAAEALGRR